MPSAGLFQKIKRMLWPKPHDRDTEFVKTSQTNGNPAKAEDTPLIDTVDLDLGNAFHQAIFSSDELHTTKLSVPETLILQVVESNLKSSNYRLKAVPRLPSVVPQLLKSLRDPDSSADQYVDIIKQDPVIASAVLKMANSTYFNPSGSNIDSFQRAVVTLGLQGLRSLLSAAVMQPIIQCKSTYFVQFGKKLWEHSLCCAVCCQLLCEQYEIDPFKAYLLGLVHDIGKITIFTQLAQQFKLNAEQQPPAHAFVQLMDKMDLQLSYWIAKDWGFPDDILQGLRDQKEAQAHNKMSNEGKLLFLANQACEAYLLHKNDRYSEQEVAILLEKLALPSNLFEQLDTLYIQPRE